MSKPSTRTLSRPLRVPARPCRHKNPINRRLLKKAGLVKDRKEGRWAWYALTDRKDNKYTMPMLALLFGWLDDDASVRSDKRKLAVLKETARKGCD